MSKIEKYTGMVIQPHVTVAEDRGDIERNLDRVLNMIDFGVGYFWELPVKLVVLPEYFLQGVTTPGKGEHGIEGFMKKAITFDGPEMRALGDKAREYGLYISGGGVVEQVPEFPDRWFNAAFVIGPSGEVVLRYHKWHIPANIGLGTSPHDLLDQYREVFGADIKDLFPVIDTEIGKLGTMTCHDGCTPEVSRALGYNGCEVLCHPTALQEIEGVSEPWDFWTFTRRTRAHDNMCYLLGSNWGTVDYDYYPRAFCPGGSFIIDYTGMMLRHANYPSEQVIGATIDIEALREHRSRCGHNCWVDVRTEGFKQIY
ncbi:MAG: nitrilase, partial [Gammaproteobacteria bacterium]|nr:nitrilase [Gammaproteobacteria bacterium]